MIWDELHFHYAVKLCVHMAFLLLIIHTHFANNRPVDAPVLIATVVGAH